MKRTKVKPGAAPAPPGEGEFSLIPNNKLLNLYALMLKCRMIAKAVPSAKKDRRKHSRLVSEAVTAGVTIDLLASDAISPMSSDLTSCAIKVVAGKSIAQEGVALKTLLRWWSSPSARVPSIVSRANVIPPAESTAARLEAALRLAAHFRSTNSGSVVVFFVGPDTLRSKRGASPDISAELLQSCLSRAAVERLPILFVVQSETDADEYLPLSQRSGVPGMVVDRDDVVAVYRVASEAFTHARRGNGPTLIDSKPWLLKSPARKPPERPDCLGKMELYLVGKGLVYRTVKDRIRSEFAVELRRAVNALARPGKY